MKSGKVLGYRVTVDGQTLTVNDCQFSPSRASFGPAASGIRVECADGIKASFMLGRSFFVVTVNEAGWRVVAKRAQIVPRVFGGEWESERKAKVT